MVRKTKKINVRRRLKEKEERAYMLMMNKDRLNQHLVEAIEDSGWKVKWSGATSTTWERSVLLKPDAIVAQIIKFLQDSKDYPGWTGIHQHRVISGTNSNILLMYSTYDSGD